MTNPPFGFCRYECLGKLREMTDPPFTNPTFRFCRISLACSAAEDWLQSCLSLSAARAGSAS